MRVLKNPTTTATATATTMVLSEAGETEAARGSAVRIPPTAHKAPGHSLARLII